MGEEQEEVSRKMRKRAGTNFRGEVRYEEG